MRSGSSVSISPDAGCGSTCIALITVGSLDAIWLSQQRRDSQLSEARSWTRWLRMGDRRGSRAGGGCLDALAVDKQARSEGSKSRVLGGGMYSTATGMFAEGRASRAAVGRRVIARRLSLVNKS